MEALNEPAAEDSPLLPLRGISSAFVLILRLLLDVVDGLLLATLVLRTIGDVG